MGAFETVGEIMIPLTIKIFQGIGILIVLLSILKVCLAIKNKEKFGKYCIMGIAGIITFVGNYALDYAVHYDPTASTSFYPTTSIICAVVPVLFLSLLMILKKIK